MTRVRAGAALVVAVVATALAGVLVDRAIPVAQAGPAPAATAGTATSGVWFCATGAVGDDGSLSVAVAVPPTSSGTSADTAVGAFREGAIAPSEEVVVAPGTAVRREVAVPGAGGVAPEPTASDDDPLAQQAAAPGTGLGVRWWGAPAVASRSRTTGGDLPDGIVAGACEPRASDTWILPGTATTGGAEAHLLLANPFASDASVAVALTTAEGRLEPQRLENVVVPARSVRDVLLNDHAPERADLGAVVRLRSGRVVAEGYQVVNAAVGGIDGVSLAKAAPQPSETWSFPWFEVAPQPHAEADEVQSWLWVSNADDRGAALALTVHTGDGGAVPEGLAEVTVGPGEVDRIDLRDVLPPGAAAGGLTLQSRNGVPVTASIATQVAGDSPERTGLAVQLGAPAPDATWVASVGDVTDRSVRVHLANPGADPAVVDLAVWDGSTVSRPGALAGIDVPAGTSVSVPLADVVAAAGDVSVFATASEGSVVVGHDARSAEGPLRLVAGLAVPSATWSAGVDVPRVVHDPTLSQRIGTDLGVPSPDALTPSPDEPATSVTPTAAATPSR